jgi:S-adenosylmethionine:tRNA ribosyltransferase-isomerase
MPKYLESGTTFILNNTRVIEARILFQKPTGGVIEIFCLEPTDEYNIENAISHSGPVRWNCLIGGASKWKPGQVLQKELLINGRQAMLSAHYIEKLSDSFVIEFSWQSPDVSFGEVVHAAGAIPLPPYIKREAIADDANRYQTIFARHQGSVAAPTAALHFTDTVFKKLAQKDIHPSYITLHVGAGTFKPVKTETIAEHAMHAEHFHVSLKTLEKLAGSRTIVAVGTTSLRTLESLYWIGIKIIRHQFSEIDELVLEQWEAYELKDENISYSESMRAIIGFMEQQNMEEVFCRTSLIIVPGYTFRSAKALLTNFHQPQSTLLLLVAAFIGDDWEKVYQHALDNDYRFLSYGDSSLLMS